MGETEKEGETEQIWTRQKPGARHFIGVSHMGSNHLYTGAITCCLPRCISRELIWKWGCWELAYAECRHYRQQFNLMHHSTSP